MATTLAEGRDRYTLIRCLGRGATSSVWLAEREGTGERVALKVGAQSSERGRLCDEAERLLLANSPALTAALDAGFLVEAAEAGEPRERLPFIALEWAEGKSVDAFRATSPDEREHCALRVARDVAEALSALHGIGSSHGDVKPANVVLSSAGRARLIDLGLSADASAEPLGGTPRYLAPESFDPNACSDGRARDLWALGLTLAEVADPSVAGAVDPVIAWQGSHVSGALRSIVTALLGPAGARPSARWVKQTALAALGEQESEGEQRSRRCREVERAYLAVRSHEVELAARSERAELAVHGQPGRWLADAIARLRQIQRVRGRLLSEQAPALAPLEAIGRSRWLVTLVGASAAAWPDVAMSEEELALRLLELAAVLEPEVISFAHLTTGRSGELVEPVPEDPIELALALSQPMPPPAVLERLERWARRGDTSPRLRIELCRKLRLKGELGRALAVIDLEGSGPMRVEAAEVLRRAGERARARHLLEDMETAGLDSAVLSRRASVLARLAFDAGSPGEGLALLRDAPASSTSLETRALCELAGADRAAAARSIEAARLLASSEEERARVEAVAASLAHAAGDSSAALRGFTLAAEHASRAGALLEEATYQTGIAASASNLAEIGKALDAARRAILLFEYLGRTREAARAALSRAAAYAQAGAILEAREAARDAIRRAKAAGDRRCRAYAHLAIADVLPAGDREGLEHAERARQLLSDASVDDRLRAAARLLRRGAPVDAGELDPLARDSACSVEPRLDWWGARAAVALRSSSSGRPDQIVMELSALLAVPAPVCVRGAAFAYGAQLAARTGDSEAARRLALASSEAARQLVAGSPAELRSAVAALDWVSGPHVPQERSLLPEQIQDVEGLVRALGRRDRLRPLLDQVLDALVLWTGVERGLLLLRAPGGKLVVRSARNLLRSDLTGEQLALSRTLAERALAEREPVVAVDAAGELSEVHASVHLLKLRSVLAVPLLAQGEALGVVYLDDRVRRGAFGPDQLAWVRLVATLAAVAIREARDQLLLRKAARRAQRAESRLSVELARSQAELDIAERELAHRKQRDTRFEYDKIIGRSPAVREMLRIVDRVTTSEVPVLIVGESGSGKELIARAIHDNGSRRAQAFVSENCAAIPETLLESTLFGHVRGAFTGANRPRAGLFEVADHGTLFLDEIADMSLAMQTKLLRVLQEGELRPIGSERSRRVDVRVIGASHRDLDALVAAGKFRQDLLYRLNVIRVRVPPLRERAGDIALLVDHFVARYGAGRKMRFAKAALDALSRHAWPGNVRQLENEIRRALVLADDVIDVEHLSPEVRDPERGERRPDGLNLKQRVDALELELVRTALERTSGNQTRAAELLGVSRFGLQKMMKRLDILPDAGRRRTAPTH